VKLQLLLLLLSSGVGQQLQTAGIAHACVEEQYAACT
jgi:hypothetical protein